jgi:hypothetical protein
MGADETIAEAKTPRSAAIPFPQLTGIPSMA